MARAEDRRLNMVLAEGSPRTALPPDHEVTMADEEALQEVAGQHSGAVQPVEKPWRGRKRARCAHVLCHVRGVELRMSLSSS